MAEYDTRMELAPRDIVARAIFREQQEGHEVYLDIRHKGQSFLQKRFPNIYAELKNRGFNLTSDLIPVTPAAHYACGGIKVDLYGRTNIANLFAFGEVACSGVHGANRLASNSLLEAVVFPLRLEELEFHDIGIDSPSRSHFVTPGRWPEGLLPGEIHEIRSKLQQLMWEKVGIVRTKEQLTEALEQINKWENEIEQFKGTNQELAELQNMIEVAELITSAALNRRKSLGAHFVLS